MTSADDDVFGNRPVDMWNGKPDGCTEYTTVNDL